MMHDLINVFEHSIDHHFHGYVYLFRLEFNNFFFFFLNYYFFFFVATYGTFIPQRAESSIFV